MNRNRSRDKSTSYRSLAAAAPPQPDHGLPAAAAVARIDRSIARHRGLSLARALAAREQWRPEVVADEWRIEMIIDSNDCTRDAPSTDPDAPIRPADDPRR